MNEKENKLLKCLLFASLFMLIAFVLLAFWEFTNKSSNHARMSSEQQVTEFAIGSAHSINIELTNTLKVLKAVSVGFENFNDLHSQEALNALERIEAASPFQHIWLATKDGMAMKADGRILDISQREYFTKAMQGVSAVSDTLMSVNDGQEIIIFYTPIKQNDKIVGVMSGIYDISKLSEITQLGNKSGEGYTLLIKQNGEFILSPDSDVSLINDEQNAWEIFGKAVFSNGSSFNEFYEGVQNNQSGIITYSIGDQVRSACYSPIKVNDWYLLQVITKEVIEEHYMVINQIALVLIIKIIGVFLILGSITLYTIDKTRRSRVEDLNKLKLLTDNIPGGVAELLVGEDLVVQYANDGFFALTGYTKEEYMGGFIKGHGTRIILEEDLEESLGRVMEDIEHDRPLHTEYRLKRKDGSIIWISAEGSVLKKLKKGAVIQAIFIDITLQKNQTAKILENSKLDKMTGLYDKISVQETIQSYLKNNDLGTINALIAIDIDDFKKINDSYGHQVGDEAIVLLAQMLKSYFRSTDILGRIGGDEYLVLMRNVKDREYVKLKIDSFVQGTSSLEVVSQVGMLACSIGVVTFIMKENLSFELLFGQADSNLYQAKNSGKNKYVVTEYEEPQEVP